jgi:hypothetical protein
MKVLIFIFLYLVFNTKVSALECPAGKYPVREHSRTEYYRHDGTFVSGTNINESCREYLSTKALVLNFQSNTPKRWPHKKEKFRNWTEKEKLELRKALSELPPILTQIGELKVYRALKSEINDNPATSAPDVKIITIYDEISKHELKRVLTHELAHIYYLLASKEEKLSYNSSAQWIYDYKKQVYYSLRKDFTAEDGKLNPEEDFANNIEFYFFDRKSLEKQPEVIKWIQKMVGDQ